MPAFSCSASVSAPPAAVWALLVDPERFAALFTYMTVDEVEAPAPDCRVFRRRLALPNLPPLWWREEDQATGDGELSFRALEGDLQVFQGCWRVTAAGDGAQLTLELDYAIPTGIGPSLPEALAAFIMNELFRAIFNRVVEAAQVEAR